MIVGACLFRVLCGMIATTARDTYGAQQFGQPATLLIGQRRRLPQDGFDVFFGPPSAIVTLGINQFGVVGGGVHLRGYLG